jgi:hypothetical protein
MDKDAVAVRLGLGDRSCADRAACAGAVLDHDGLAEFSRKPIEHQSRHDIGGAAGAKGNGRLDKARRPGFRLGSGGKKDADGGEKDAVEQAHFLLRF